MRIRDLNVLSLNELTNTKDPRIRAIHVPGSDRCAAYPTTNGGMQNGSSVGIRTRCIHVFACLYAQSVIIDKISASELSRKFIKRLEYMENTSWTPLMTPTLPTCPRSFARSGGPCASRRRPLLTPADTSAR